MRARIVGLTLVGVGALAVAAAVPAGSWSPLLPADLPLERREAVVAEASRRALSALGHEAPGAGAPA